MQKSWPARLKIFSIKAWKFCMELNLLHWCDWESAQFHMQMYQISSSCTISGGKWIPSRNWAGKQRAPAIQDAQLAGLIALKLLTRLFSPALQSRGSEFMKKQRCWLMKEDILEGPTRGDYLRICIVSFFPRWWIDYYFPSPQGDLYLQNMMVLLWLINFISTEEKERCQLKLRACKLPSF